MTKQQDLIGNLEQKYAEWFETWPEYHDDLLIQILASLLVKSNEELDYVKKREMAMK